MMHYDTIMMHYDTIMMHYGGEPPRPVQLNAKGEH